MSAMLFAVSCIDNTANKAMKMDLSFALTFAEDVVWHVNAVSPIFEKHIMMHTAARRIVFK